MQATPVQATQCRRRVGDNESVGMDTGAAIDRFLEHGGLAAATRRAYGSDLRSFAAWLERSRLTLDDVDARVLADFVGERLQF